MENGSRKTRKSVGKKKMIGIITIISILVIAIAGLGAYYLHINSEVKGWEDKIYPGVQVENIDISGMSKEEATHKLNEMLTKKVTDKTLSVVVGDKESVLKYSDINPTYDIEKVVNEAYEIGKQNGVFGKHSAIRKKEKTTLNVEFTYDEDKLAEFEQNVANETNKEPINATINIKNGNIIVNQDVDGLAVNAEKLHSLLLESINGDLNSNVKIDLEVEVIKAKVTATELSKIDGVMGTFTTNYSTSAAGRSHNIQLATNSINGTILMPGETFSFNEIVGPRTVATGYQEAGTYVGNKVEPGIGGGICQVSTTLYRAVMRANIKSVERTNHSMVVGYADPGLDATVSYGYLDYKFTNTYNFPIYIEGYTHNKNVTYNVYGNLNGLNGKTYDMKSQVTETIYPEVKYVDDNTLNVGTEVVEGGGTTGYKSIAYQITYQNGVEINREIVSRDSYAKVDKIIKKGTLTVAPVQPEEIIEVTPEGEPNANPEGEAEVNPGV